MTTQPARDRSGRSQGAVRSYLRFAGLAFVSVLAIAVVGYFPTVRWASAEAVPALLAGCGVSFASSCIGAIPVARASGGQRTPVATAVLVSAGARFVSVLVLVVPIALSGWVDRGVFVVWVGVSYLLLLLLDSIVAVRALARERTDGN